MKFFLVSAENPENKKEVEVPDNMLKSSFDPVTQPELQKDSPDPPIKSRDSTSDPVTQPELQKDLPDPPIKSRDKKAIKAVQKSQSLI